MPRPSVVILGAGLAGLTLRQCLRQKGIAASIYESADLARYSKRHSYGIWLQPWAYKPLLDVLGIDESTFRKCVAVDSRQESDSTRNHAPSQSAPFRACRNKLEAFLREDQSIRFSSELSSAAFLESNGKIEISFTDGLKLQPALVVDSLGVHSQLRKLLLPRIHLEVHPFAVYNGKRNIDAHLFSSVYASTFGDDSVIVRRPVRAGDPRLEISVKNYQSDGSVSISYTYSRPIKGNLHDIDPVFNSNRSTSGATTIPEEYYQELANFIDGTKLGDPFKDCFDPGRVRAHRVLHWLMRSVMVPKEDLLRLSRYGVIMIGDSAHAVTILGGHGGNLAILDAVKLSEILSSKLELSMPVPEDETRTADDFSGLQWDHWHKAVENVKPDLAAMYDTMWNEWNNAVAKSKDELTKMHVPPPGITGSLSPANGP